MDHILKNPKWPRNWEFVYKNRTHIQYAMHRDSQMIKLSLRSLWFLLNISTKNHLRIYLIQKSFDVNILWWKKLWYKIDVQCTEAAMRKQFSFLHTGLHSLSLDLPFIQICNVLEMIRILNLHWNERKKSFSWEDM